MALVHVRRRHHSRGDGENGIPTHIRAHAAFLEETLSNEEDSYNAEKFRK
jgi:hypothetical protein